MRYWKRVVLTRRLLVNLKTDKAISGVLREESATLLVLIDAQLLEPGRDQPLPLDGEVVIDKTNVDFAQVTS